MSDQISISVPNEPRAIAAAAEFFKMLSGEAVKIGVEEPATTDGGVFAPDPEAVPPVPTEVLAPDLEIPAPPAVDVPPPPPSAPVTGDLPWDARIHSSSRAKNADGTWRNRRNLDKTVLATITAELTQAMGAPAAPVVPPPPPVADVPPPPVTPAAPVALTFAGLLKRITAGGITKDQATAAAVKLGLPSFALVATRPDLIPALAAELGVA